MGDPQKFDRAPGDAAPARSAVPQISRDTIRRVWVERNDQPTFKVVVLFVTALAMFLCLFALIFILRQNEQIEAETATVEQLKAQGDTIRGDLVQTSSSLDVIQSETKTPHPILADRDAQLIGEHVDITWTDESQARFSQPIYAISLKRLPNEVSRLPSKASASPNQAAFNPSTVSSHSQPDSTHSDHLPVCSIDIADLSQANLDEDIDCEESFIASDSGHRTSRIPIQINKALRPGHYVWRVAAVSQGYETHLNRDFDIGMLSRWSNYGSFTVASDLKSRINATQTVRVGVNLSQNSRFARDEGGIIVGDDVDLVSVLVQGCIKRDAVSNKLHYNETACNEYVSAFAKCRAKQASMDGLRQNDALPCLKKPADSLRVEFVSISRWGDWKEAIKRREVDLFVGGLTAAHYREGGGVVFVKKGYLQYQTLLYVSSADSQYSNYTFTEWTSQPRRIGVIENSSNEVLLDYMVASRCTVPETDSKSNPHARRCPVQKVLYPDYPELDRAMDIGGIDGILIDSTFVSRGEWTHLVSPAQLTPYAWKQYQQNFLGYGGLEHLSFAASMDASTSSSGGLLDALDHAMQNESVKDLVRRMFDMKSSVEKE